MSKYTSGSWYVEAMLCGSLGVRAKGGYICSMMKPNRYNDQEDRYKAEMEAYEADAHLISAGPEMYSALTDIARYIGNKPFKSDGEKLILIRCEVALAKAEGRE